MKWGEEIGSTLDNFTDALMIQNAVHPVSEHVLQDAVRVSHMEFMPSTGRRKTVYKSPSPSPAEKRRSTILFITAMGIAFFEASILLSIPYEDGWNVKVNGEDAEYSRLEGMFCLFPKIHVIPDLFLTYSQT